MVVKYAKILGYCMGVRRAVNIAEHEAEQLAQHGKRVFSIGPLIHNPFVVQGLAGKGIAALSNEDLEHFEAREGDRLIIRAHGISPQKRHELAGRGISLIDATCPIVMHSHKKIALLARNNKTIVVAGEAYHAEVHGLCGAIEETGAKAVVIQNAEEAQTVTLEQPFAVISQTTIKPSEYKAIIDILSARFGNFGNVNAICAATHERQEALEELGKECEALIIIGGRNSANTQALFKKAEETGKPSYLIETEAELPPEIFNYKIIGISAGASTPDEKIEAVAARLRAGESVN